MKFTKLLQAHLLHKKFKEKYLHNNPHFLTQHNTTADHEIIEINIENLKKIFDNELTNN